MILPCEIAVRSIVPAIRAAITKELVEEHYLKQNEVAKILGISQSAVSKYTRQVRGYVVRTDNIEEIQPLINDMIDLLRIGNVERANFLSLFCQTCLILRKKGLMCQFCRKTDPNIYLEDCKFCRNFNPLEDKR